MGKHSKTQAFMDHPYLVTHHLRDVDRYLDPIGSPRRPRVYALLRSGSRYASVSVFVGPGGWSPETRDHIGGLVTEASEPYSIGKYSRPGRVTMGDTMARAEHVSPDRVHWLCQRIVDVLGAAPEVPF